jgi:uncharacterized protein (DUF342 family)
MMADRDQSTTTADAPPSYEVRLSSDRLAMLVSAPDPHADLAGLAARITHELPQFELAVEIGIEVIHDLLKQSCAPGEHLVEFPLLTGQPPEPPRDGEVQWQGDFFADGFAVDEDTGRVDYWERAEHRAVTEDQLLAILVLPRDGTPGRTLQDTEIPVPKPKTARLRAGKGVRTEEQEDRVLYYAAVAGRLQSKDGNVSVEDVYAIRGDVGLETGNIRHTGAVVVQGDVKEGARIETDGDVMIKGMVEPATIVCGGDLTVGGGLLGDDGQRIEVGGDLQARYLNEVHLRCAGNVTILGQIDHCHVEAGGRVHAARGRIAGGTVRAYKGIEVGQAGARGATGTVMIVGSDWRQDEALCQRRERMQRLQQGREKINEAIARALAIGTLDGEREALVARLREKLGEIDAAMAAEGEAQAAAAEQSVREGVREIAIHAELWCGVTFRIGSAATTSDRNFDVPRLVALRRDKVRILPMGNRNAPA